MKNMTGAIYVAGPLDYETRRRVSRSKSRPDQMDAVSVKSQREILMLGQVKRFGPENCNSICLLSAMAEQMIKFCKNIQIVLNGKLSSCNKIICKEN